MFIRLARNKFRGEIQQSALFVGFWQANRLVMQALWLVLVARLLGADELGEFAGLVGLATTLGGFSGLGFGLVMFQDAVRDRTILGARWRSTMLVTGLSGIALSVAFVGAGAMLTASQPSLTALLAIALAELIAFPVTAAGAFAFAAHERMGWSAALPALMALARLAASTIVWFSFDQPTMLHVALAHSAASCGTALFSVAVVVALLKPAPGRTRIEKRELSLGFRFCSVGAGTSALSSMDKAMALRWGGGEIAGLYSVVYRVSALFAMPIEVLTTSATPRLFRSSHAGDQERRLVDRLALWALAYSAIAATILWCLAPFAPLVFGHEFEGSVTPIRAMTLFIPLYGLRVLGGNILLARGLAALQAKLQAAGILAMLASGILLVPRFGLWGCVCAGITTEALLCLMIWAAIKRGKGSSSTPP